MGVQVAPVLIPWDVHLAKHILLLKNSFTTNEFVTFNEISAQLVDPKIDYTATFKKLIDALHLDPKYKTTTDELNQINKQTVTEGKDYYKEFSDTVEGLKDTEPNKPKWELEIDRTAEETKRKSNAAIDRARDAAKAVINKLPEPAREAATNVFLSGFQAVAQFFENVWAQIKAVAESVYQFILGVWNKIKTAWNTVVSAAELAWKLIGGIVAQLSNDSSAVHSAPVGHHNHGHAASTADFTPAGGISTTSTGGHTGTGHLN